MEQKILEWLCDFIIPLDIKNNKDGIEKVYLDALTSEYLQIGIDKEDGSNEKYRVRVGKVTGL